MKTAGPSSFTPDESDAWGKLKSNGNSAACESGSHADKIEWPYYIKIRLFTYYSLL